MKLRHHGVEIGAHERSTNVRHADDLMLYAVSCQDLVYMIETRMMELARLNGSQHATFVTVATWRCVVRCEKFCMAKPDTSIFCTSYYRGL